MYCLLVLWSVRQAWPEPMVMEIPNCVNIISSRDTNTLKTEFIGFQLESSLLTIVWLRQKFFSNILDRWFAIKFSLWVKKPTITLVISSPCPPSPWSGVDIVSPSQRSCPSPSPIYHCPSEVWLLSSWSPAPSYLTETSRETNRSKVGKLSIFSLTKR